MQLRRSVSDQAFARLGGSVASAGDVNSDGYADVIRRRERYDAGEQDEGAAFLFLGGADWNCEWRSEHGAPDWSPISRMPSSASVSPPQET
jgi:hypothetical protein